MVDFLSLFREFGPWVLIVAFLIYTNWLREKRMAQRLDLYGDRGSKREVQMLQLLAANAKSQRHLARVIRNRLPPQPGAKDDDESSVDEPDDLPEIKPDTDMQVALKQRERAIAGAMLLGAMLLLLGGCGYNRSEQTQANSTSQQRARTVTTTERVAQALTPAGAVVELRSVERVTSDTTTSGQTTTDTASAGTLEVEPPRIVDALKTAATAVADRVAPGGGAVVDWAWQAVSGALGVGAAGAATKSVLDARRRRRLEEDLAAEEERKRRIAKAMDDYADDIEKAETDEDVRAVKSKHQARQRALGIHDDIERLRHV